VRSVRRRYALELRPIQLVALSPSLCRLTFIPLLASSLGARSTITAWAISNISAFVAIIIFTKSLYIATMTTLCIFFIVLTLLWFMVAICQWPLGAMEALSITIFVGMSCDYCLHIAHAFMHSQAPSAHLKVREALAIIGNSVLGAAVTTFGSCIFLLLCTIVFFEKVSQCQ